MVCSSLDPPLLSFLKIRDICFPAVFRNLSQPPPLIKNYWKCHQSYLLAPSAPMDTFHQGSWNLFMFTFLKYFLTWHLPPRVHLPCFFAFRSSLWDLGFLKGGLTGKDWGKEDIQYLSFCHVLCNKVLCNQVHHFIQQWAHSFPSFHFVTNIFTDALVIYLVRINSSWALAFLSWSLAAQTMSLYSFQFTCPFFEPLYASFWGWVWTGHLVHPWGSMLRWTSLELGGGDLWILTSCFGLLFLQVIYLMGLFQVDLWRGKYLLSWNPRLWAFHSSSSLS